MAYAVEAISEGACPSLFHNFTGDPGVEKQDLWDKKVKDEFCERFIYIKEFD